MQMAEGKVETKQFEDTKARLNEVLDKIADGLIKGNLECLNTDMPSMRGQLDVVPQETLLRLCLGQETGKKLLEQAINEDIADASKEAASSHYQVKTAQLYATEAVELQVLPCGVFDRSIKSGHVLSQSTRWGTYLRINHVPGYHVYSKVHPFIYQAQIIVPTTDVTFGMAIFRLQMVTLFEQFVDNG
jgi:hypothetical protein